MADINYLKAVLSQQQSVTIVCTISSSRKSHKSQCLTAGELGLVGVEQRDKATSKIGTGWRKKPAKQSAVDFLLE